MKICNKCNIKKSEDAFSWKKKDIKRHSICKQCHNSYVKNLYNSSENYRKSHIERVNKNKKKYLNESKSVILKWKQNGCIICNEKEICCLAAHHLNPKEKDFTIASYNKKAKYKKAVLEELKKCICVCHNCHAKIHNGLIEVPAVGQR